jgi:hypothetical protein
MMARNKPRNIVQSNKGGVFQDLALRIKLILRLMADKRVSPLLKIIPVGSLIYLIVPDLLPLNPIDDALVLWLGTYLFVELCPPEVVEEHMKALKQTIAADWKDAPQEEEGDIIDAEFTESEPQGKEKD